jgi:hypothetical protein
MKPVNLSSTTQRAADITSTTESSHSSLSQKVVPVKPRMDSRAPALLANLPKRATATTSSQTADTVAPWHTVQNPAMRRAFEKLPNELRHDIGTRLDSADLRNFSQVDAGTRHALSGEVTSLNLSASAKRVSNPQDVANVMAGINQLNRPALRTEPLQNLGNMGHLDPAARGAAFNSVLDVAAGSDSSRKELLPVLAHSFGDLTTPDERSQALEKLIGQVQQMPLNQQANMMGSIRLGARHLSGSERVRIYSRIMQEQTRIHRASTDNRAL